MIELIESEGCAAERNETKTNARRTNRTRLRRPRERRQSADALDRLDAVAAATHAAHDGFEHVGFPRHHSHRRHDDAHVAPGHLREHVQRFRVVGGDRVDPPRVPPSDVLVVINLNLVIDLVFLGGMLQEPYDGITLSMINSFLILR